MKLENLKIAIIGLGYVGLPLAVEFGKKLPVIGFDIHQKRIQELQRGPDNILEAVFTSTNFSTFERYVQF